VLSVDLHKQDSLWVYNVVVLTDDGRYCDVTVDAKRNLLLAMRWR